MYVSPGIINDDEPIKNSKSYLMRGHSAMNGSSLPVSWAASMSGNLSRVVRPSRRAPSIRET